MVKKPQDDIPWFTDLSVLVERVKATFRLHSRAYLLNVIWQNHVCTYHAYNSTCLAGMRDRNLHVLWIRQGLYFDPGKYPQLYTLHSDFRALEQPCGFQPECWETGITTISSHRIATWAVYPLKAFFPPTACSLCDTHFGNSPRALSC